MKRTMSKLLVLRSNHGGESMKRFFKAAAVAVLVFSVAVFGAVFHGAERLPDSISVADAETVDLGVLYSVDVRQAQPAGTGAVNRKYEGRISAMGLFPVKDITVSVAKRRYVVPGGDVFGIKLYTKGIMVVSLDSVTTSDGSRNPAESAGLKCGDIITHINGEKAKNSQQLTEAVENSNGSPVKLTVQRNGENMQLNLKPQLSVNGKYKAGIWVRDSSAGIGTVTFYDDSAKMFAGLGHGVCDIDTGKIMPLNNGEAVKAKVNGFYKSSAGNPGELCGVFSDSAIGPLFVNHEMGVYGTLLNSVGRNTIPVALETEVKLGAAQMITTIDDNGPQYYDVEIIKIYPTSDLSARNMIIKVTDPVLLEKTGGIVQGMSGSPIVQNSMLVGAVTHVFVSEPSQGYAVFAQRMVNTMESLQTEDNNKAS